VERAEAGVGESAALSSEHGGELTELVSREAVETAIAQSTHATAVEPSFEVHLERTAVLSSTTAGSVFSSPTVSRIASAIIALAVHGSAERWLTAARGLEYVLLSAAAGGALQGFNMVDRRASSYASTSVPAELLSSAPLAFSEEAASIPLGLYGEALAALVREQRDAGIRRELVLAGLGLAERHEAMRSGVQRLAIALGLLLSPRAYALRDRLYALAEQLVAELLYAQRLRKRFVSRVLGRAVACRELARGVRRVTAGDYVMAEDHNALVDTLACMYAALEAIREDASIDDPEVVEALEDLAGCVSGLRRARSLDIVLPEDHNTLVACTELARRAASLLINAILARYL